MAVSKTAPSRTVALLAEVLLCFGCGDSALRQAHRQTVAPELGAGHRDGAAPPDRGAGDQPAITPPDYRAGDQPAITPPDHRAGDRLPVTPPEGGLAGKDAAPLATPCGGKCTSQQICVCGSCLPSSTLQVGAESNLTGNPIGGGIGYTKGVARSQAKTVVKTPKELLDALKVAKSGNVIYVDDQAEIDLSGQSGILVPSGVVLASGRGTQGSSGALLFTNTSSSSGNQLFYLNGAKARITGLRLRGPDPEIGDYHDLVEPSCGIAARSLGIEVDNCELWAWGNAAVSVALGATGNYIHHNHIHHNRADGLGYGVTVGSDDPSHPCDVIIEANLFDFNRHEIASSGYPYSSYEARYNIALDHSRSHHFDRHGTLHPGEWYDGDGGEWTRIHHNTIWDVTQYAVAIRGTPTKKAEIHHNWFFQPSSAKAVFVHSTVTSNVSVSDNAFGSTTPVGTCSPIAQAKVTPTTGTAPLAVSFDSAGSVFVDGALISYAWDFGDGTGAVGKQASHTYASPGSYLASLTVTDNRGVPARAYVAVIVRPPGSGKYFLNFRVKDGTRKTLVTYCYKRVMLGNQVVFKEDVSGPGDWKQVHLDVTAAVGSQSQVELKLQAFCDKATTSNDFPALSVLFDDVILFGGAVKDGDFEACTGWKYSENGSYWSGGCSNEDVWTGRLAYRFLLPYGHATAAAKSWAQAAQTVTLNP